jgi:hypothetical protein
MTPKLRAQIERTIKAARREAVTNGSWAYRDALAVTEAAWRMILACDDGGLTRLALPARAWMGKNGGHDEFPASRRAGLDLLAQTLGFVDAKRDLKAARDAVRCACEWTGIPLPTGKDRERAARFVSAEWERRDARNAVVAARIVLKALGDPRADNAYKAEIMRVKRRKQTGKRPSNKR